MHSRVAVESRGRQVRPVGWVQSSAMLVRREAARQVGWLDPDFFVYSDETDFCKRLHDAGWRILFVPGARAVHHDQLSTDSAAMRRRIVEFHRNRDLYFRKHGMALTRIVWKAVLDLGLPGPRGRGAVLPGHDPRRYLLHARQELVPRTRRGDPRGGRACTTRAEQQPPAPLRFPTGWNTPTSPSLPPSAAPSGRCSSSSHAERLALLAGLVVLAVAEGALAYSLGTGSLDRLSGAAGLAAAALGIAGRGRGGGDTGAAAGDRAGRGADRRAVPAAAVVRQRRHVPRTGRRRRPPRAAAAALLRARGGRRSRSAGVPCAAASCARCPSLIAAPAAAFFAFACLSLLWADDLEAGANLLAVLHAPVRRCCSPASRAPTSRTASREPWQRPRSRWRRCSPLVGLWQAATHELFFYAPNLAVSNANTDFFRVTSLFGDPSLYGRHLVLGIGVALSLLAARRWRPWPLIALLVIMWAGLFFSYSQSSMVALLVVTLALAVRYRRPARAR